MLRSTRPRRRPPFAPAPLAVAALLGVAGLNAGAQALPPVRKAPPPEPPHEAASAPSTVITLTADNVVSHIGGLAQARGDVQLKRADVLLRADYVTYDQLSDTAHAEGHVRIDRGLDWFSASRMDLEVTRNAGTLLDTEYEFGATKAGGHASRIELVSRERATAYDGDYSSCPRDVPGRPPDWVIQGQKIDIDTSTNEGHATHAVLRFLGVPILAAPSFTFPVTSERKSGWLPPTADFSNSSGLSVGVPYYWNLRPNVDMTLTPEIITRRGAALTTELRYLGSGDLGQVTGYSIPTDQLTGGDARGSIQWAHEGSRADWLSYSARWQRVSDDQYWKDFPHQMPALTQRLLPLDLSGTRRFLPFGDAGEIDTYARVQRFQTLQDYEDPSAVILSPYQRTPQIGMRGNVTLQNRLKLSWEAEGNRFDLSDQERPLLEGFPADNRDGGTRAHLIGAISREFASPWGRFEPRVSLNGASYHTDAPMTDGRTAVTRWIPTFSADSSFSFEKQNTLFGHDVVQTLEPRLLYVLTPYHDQSALPLYDSAPKDFNEVSIYSDNQFTGVDRISDENQLTAGATTRFNDVRAVWYYVPILVGGLIPWTIFGLVLPWRIGGDLIQRRRRLTNVEWRLVIWTLAPLLLFTASIGKQPRYILPVLPPLAMMVGSGIANRIAGALHDRAARQELTIATLGTAAMFAAMATLFYRGRILFVSAYPALTWTGIGVVIVAALVLGVTGVRRWWNWLPALMPVSAALLLLTLQFGAFAGKRPEAVEQIAALIHANRFGGESIGEYETFVRNLPFYTRLKQAPVTDDASAVAFLSSTDRVFLVVNRRDYARLKTLVAQPLNVIGEVTYWNTAGVRLRTLLLPLPEEDLDTVMLISNR